MAAPDKGLGETILWANLYMSFLSVALHISPTLGPLLSPLHGPALASR